MGFFYGEMMKKLFIAFLAYIGASQGFSQEQKHEVAKAVYQVAPSTVAAAGTKIAGIPLSDWLVVASIFFVFLQISFLIWKWRRQIRLDKSRMKVSFDDE